MRSPRSLLVPALTLSLLGALALPAQGDPTPGASGVGDRLFPTLGNGGYDAQHYALRLRYATARPGQGVDGTVTMRARATQDLSRLDLDFAGRSVGSVSVDGRAAGWTRVGEELVITPAAPIAAGARFTVRVRHFRARPTVPDVDDFSTVAFSRTPDGSVTAGQPNQSHLVFPSNDHPSDKATFRVRFDVPRGVTAVANGVRTARHRHGRRTVWVYRQRQPMATELTQLAVGRFTVLTRRSVGDVRVRDVVPTRLVRLLDRRLRAERGQLRWMQRQLGAAYPFSTYGSLVAQADLGFALETQTLSLFETRFFLQFPRFVSKVVMLHELAHQWFGDSVAPTRWEDVWQNEGHASYYEYRYADALGVLPRYAGYRSFEALMKAAYAASADYRASFGPVGRPRDGTLEGLFNPNVYLGGALVLYALEQEIGTPAFRRVERAWVTDNEGRSASTADFVALASQVAGRDLTGFLDGWLYGATTPPMPGHPDWTVDPVSRAGRTADSLTRLVERTAGA